MKIELRIILGLKINVVQNCSPVRVAVVAAAVCYYLVTLCRSFVDSEFTILSHHFPSHSFLFFLSFSFFTSLSFLLFLSFSLFPRYLPACLLLYSSLCLPASASASSSDFLSSLSLSHLPFPLSFSSHFPSSVQHTQPSPSTFPTTLHHSVIRPTKFLTLISLYS